MKILILTKYSRIGASSRLRTLQYIPYLESQGFSCTVQSLFDDQYLHSLYKHSRRSPWAIALLYLKRLFALTGCFRYDLIWIEYEIFPYLPAFAERLLRRMGKAYVVDYDDAIFHNYDRSTNRLIRTLMGRKIEVVMRNAACVVAGNAYLAARAREAAAPCIERVPTVVDIDRYTPRQTGDGLKPVIGWIGSPSTECLLADIRDALISTCKAHGAQLLLVGASEKLADAFSGVDVDILPWCEDNEAELIARMDIGIMPLFDGPFQKGKCGYKLIQYMACAVPVIASPVGMNCEVVVTGVNGFLANTELQWKLALNSLLVSPDLRRQMGQAGRLKVEQQYCLEVTGPTLAKLLMDAAT